MRPLITPAVFFHGGPGGDGCSKACTSFFDPAVYRVVLIDQRGAGLSLPTGETRENTTALLIQDVETIREHVGVKKWHVVFGGSWGSTLALAYAQAHPEACGSLVLRGVFLVSKWELDAVLGGQFTGMVWPEEYDLFIGYLAEEKRRDPLAAYYELIMSKDPELAKSAAKEWNRWAISVSSLVPLPVADVDAILEDERWLMSYARIGVHYFVNGAFFETDQLLNGCEKIRHIPGMFVHWRPVGRMKWLTGTVRIAHGRYDLICPPRAACEIHRRLRNSQLYWSPQAGHSAMVRK